MPAKLTEQKRPPGGQLRTKVRATEVVPVRMTSDERTRFERAANAAGKPLSVWLRDLAERASRTTKGA